MKHTFTIKNENPKIGTLEISNRNPKLKNTFNYLSEQIARDSVMLYSMKETIKNKTHNKDWFEPNRTEWRRRKKLYTELLEQLHNNTKPPQKLINQTINKALNFANKQVDAWKISGDKKMVLSWKMSLKKLNKSQNELNNYILQF